MKRFLYDIFANAWGRFNQIWLYSDPHFGDLESYKLRRLICNITEEQFNMINFKPDMTYEDFLQGLVDIADEMQIKNINSKVGKKDAIIFLGDIGNIECIKKIKGYKILIMGNHDKGASNYQKIVARTLGELTTCEDGSQFWMVKESSNRLFDEVYEGPLMINDRLILSHEPIDVPDYMYNIHGHVHDKHAVEDEHHLNVIAEVTNYTPVALYPLLKNGLLKDINSIHRETINHAEKRKNSSLKNKSI